MNSTSGLDPDVCGGLKWTISINEDRNTTATDFLDVIGPRCLDASGAETADICLTGDSHTVYLDRTDVN